MQKNATHEWRRRSYLRFTTRTYVLVLTFVAVIMVIALFATRGYRTRQRIETDLRSMGAYFVAFDDTNQPSWVSFAVPVDSPEIAKYKAFEHIDFAGAHVTEASIGNIGGLERVGAIHLTDCDITDSQLALLTKIGSLGILRLNGSRITDEAIPAISAINGLITVDLSGTLVTDEGVALLKKLCPDVVVRREH